MGNGDAYRRVTRSMTLAETKQTGSVWIVRHGERADVVDPDWHLTAARPHDPPLTEAGFQQAAATAAALQEERIDAVYTSPFLRCVQTAAVIAVALDAPLRIEPGLCEWLNEEWFGDAHNPMDEEMQTRVLKQASLPGGARFDVSYRPIWDSASRSAATAKAYRQVAFPETSENAVVRYESTLEQLRERAPYSVLVTHGYGVWTMAEWLLMREVTEDCGYCCITRTRRTINLRGQEAWQCDVVAEESHLESSDGSAKAPLGLSCLMKR